VPPLLNDLTWTHAYKPKKSPFLDSPKKIPFVNQRENLKFLQNIKVQLVTLFSVYLRVLPFSDQPQKSPIPQNLSRLPSIDPFLSLSRSPNY
jgi:hypothetical protein